MSLLACPRCGGSIRFSCTLSVTTVCPVCHSPVVKDGEQLRTTGLLGTPAEDFSPIQLGVEGRHAGQRFTVIGRLQLRDSVDLCQEWYLRFEDGGDGWLSDTGHRIAILRRAGSEGGAPPPLDRIAAGARVKLDGRAFHVERRRSLRLAAAEGELPFEVVPGTQVSVVDLRRDADIVSFNDIAQGSMSAYAGRAYGDWSGLWLAGVRQLNDIQDSVGRSKDSIVRLPCAACGSVLSITIGRATHLFCPACQAQLQAQKNKTRVVAKHEKRKPLPASLALGDRAAMAPGEQYEVIGMRQRAGKLSGRSSHWTDYLLCCPGKPLRWLRETGDGWELSERLARWPDGDPFGTGPVPGDGAVRLGTTVYTKEPRPNFPARTVYAVGCFEQDAGLGQPVAVTGFKESGGPHRLIAERTAGEVQWWRARSVSSAQVKQWFGRKITAPAIGQVARVLKPAIVYAATAVAVGAALMNAGSWTSGWAIAAWAIAPLPIVLPLWRYAAGRRREAAA